MEGTGGWPTLSLTSTPEGAPSLCLRSLLTQGGDFDFLSRPRLPNAQRARPSATLGRPSIFFHHIRAVSTITYSIPTPCENHSQIAEA